jgi:hypothetical protein
MERIFIATVFKSGTKLLGHIIEKLTGLSAFPLGMEVGSNYESAAPIVFTENTFFIWHNVPTSEVQNRIRAEKAICIFLIRNIYDLIVSQYHHFAEDVDAVIGHSTGTIDYFSKLRQDEGISLLLCGAASEYFTWHGFGYYLHQIQEILKFSKEYPCHLISYDRLVLNKQHGIEQLAAFLGIHVDAEALDRMMVSSNLETMRNAQAAAMGDGKHFRKGTPGDHINVLKPHHYHMIGHLKMTYAPELDALCKELGFEDITAAALPANSDNAGHPELLSSSEAHSVA